MKFSPLLQSAYIKSKFVERIFCSQAHKQHKVLISTLNVQCSLECSSCLSKRTNQQKKANTTLWKSFRTSGWQSPLCCSLSLSPQLYVVGLVILGAEGFSTSIDTESFHSANNFLTFEKKPVCCFLVDWQ